MSARDPRAARLAGEAFSAITGLRIEGMYLAEEPLEPDEPIPLAEDDLDADLVPRPEDALPLPDAFSIESWWQEARPRFDPNVRHLAGKPFSLETLRAAIDAGPMRRRTPLALDLEIRSQGAFRLETRRWAREQRCNLEPLRPSRLTQPYAELAKAF